MKLESTKSFISEANKQINEELIEKLQDGRFVSDAEIIERFYEMLGIELTPRIKRQYYEKFYNDSGWLLDENDDLIMRVRRITHISYTYEPEQP